MKTKIINSICCLVLGLPFFPVVAKHSVHELPTFNTSEVRLIRSLSSQNYPNTHDSSNSVSGNRAAISLGKTLFFESRLSGDGSMSCATCHNPKMAWADHNQVTSLRAKYPASRHVPSLWGVKYNRWYFWDGRADSLWSQALKPIENIAEMASSRVQVAKLIINSTSLRQQYEAVFGAIPDSLLTAKLPLSARPNQIQWLRLDAKLKQNINRLFSNIGKAIAAFEETLVSKHSPFDQFAKELTIKTAKNGNYRPNTLSVSAIRGLKLFIGKTGCINCHFGPNFSDGEFHHLFLRPISLKGDLGRFNAIKTLLNDPFNANSQFSDQPKTARHKLNYLYQNIEFRGQFKTPSLRNIEKSYPYMHTGELKTLAEVVAYYNTISERMKPNGHQELLLKSLHLSTHEINDLVEFLRSLTEQREITDEK